MHKVTRRFLIIFALVFCSLLPISAHAVTYSSDIGVSFTFNTTLKVSLSNADLIISNLIPGTVSDSNIITVNAGTNNATGLTMNATVGNSTDYNNRNLTHTSDTITSNFSSVDFGSSLSSLTTDNTWGYSYSTDNQSTWSSYSGLPLYSDTTNIATLLSTSGRSTSAAGDAVNFKIAAKASSTQDSGEYRNVINFATVANPEVTGLLSISTMQEMTPDICTASAIGDEKQLTDSRDNKSYWVAKLADGGCWMTQNLDHDIDSTKTYTPDNTDIPANWTPDKSTYPTSTTTWDTSDTGNNIQQSYDPGNKIWDGVTASSNNTNLDNMAQGTNQHYHIGNYYNFGAAVAMNDTSSYITQYTDVNQSICPKGWTLPKSGNITTAGSFQNLVNQYNWASNSMTNPNMWSAPLYFPLAGWWRGSSSLVAYRGDFWSSVVYTSSTTYYMDGVYNGTVSPASYNTRSYGFSVRCVSREAGSTPGNPTLSKIETMQEMNPGICAATAVGTEKQLRDTRDNKTYWVAKLADGKCWMTQNLDLDLSTSKALTPSDSDVTSNWTPTRGTIDASAVTNNSISGWADDNNTPYSVDPGTWYYTDTFFDSTQCNSDNCNFLNNAPNGKFAKTAYVSNGEHGHVGNYYNWSAAVAMNDTSSYTADTYYNPANNPQTSICPKGWRLPTISNAIYTTNGTTSEFARLANIYANYTGSDSLSSENLEKAPLYFVRSGYVDSSQQVNAGYRGRYWSSSVYTSNWTYAFNLISHTIGARNNVGDRNHGFSVRCVSR